MEYVLPEAKANWQTMTLWHKGFPWYRPEPIITDYIDVPHAYGTYTGNFKVTFRQMNSDNTAFWMLDMEHHVVNEIDIFETMTVNGKRGIYFSIYHTSKDDLGYATKEVKKLFKNETKTLRLYNRFQTRLRNDRLMDYLSSHEVDYSVTWKRNYVLWRVGGIPIAISFSYIPRQMLHLVISNL